ncbi:MAG: hypothetical protein GY842_12365, partial [bacterium]|nr:hypothetical protein [bacterium]
MNEPPTSEWPESAAPRIGRSQAALLLCAGAITLGLVASQSTLALVILALDGPIALAIILAATLGGLWLADALLGKTAPWRWRVLLSAALGLGGVGLLVLACGVLGWLDRTCWLALLAIMSIAGVLRLWRCGAGERGCSPERLSMTPAAEAAATAEEEAEAEDRHQSNGEAGERSAGRFLWLWLAVCPFAALAILAAVTPPGVLWAEEGNGYDVLEYHLQLPKEYLEAGRIDYVPHNV